MQIVRTVFFGNALHCTSCDQAARDQQHLRSSVAQYVAGDVTQVPWDRCGRFKLSIFNCVYMTTLSDASRHWVQTDGLHICLQMSRRNHKPCVYGELMSLLWVQSRIVTPLGGLAGVKCATWKFTTYSSQMKSKNDVWHTHCDSQCECTFISAAQTSFYCDIFREHNCQSLVL